MGIAALYNDMLLDQLIFYTGVEQGNHPPEWGHYIGAVGRHQVTRPELENGPLGIPGFSICADSTARLVRTGSARRLPEL